MKTKLDSFTLAYIECALWSSTDNADESGGEPLDANYGLEDIHPDSIAKMEADCAKFQEQCGNRLDHMNEETAGHCFWLSRNGHGSGFFDEDTCLESERDTFQTRAESFGQCDIYVGDDGKLHI